MLNDELSSKKVLVRIMVVTLCLVVLVPSVSFPALAQEVPAGEEGQGGGEGVGAGAASPQEFFGSEVSEQGLPVTSINQEGSSAGTQPTFTGTSQRQTPVSSPPTLFLSVMALIIAVLSLVLSVSNWSQLNKRRNSSHR